jgi:hypothetical protein
VNDHVSGVARREIGLRLRRALDDAGLTGVAMAERLGRCSSELSRQMLGHRRISVTELVAFLTVCGVSVPEINDVVRLREEVERTGILRLSGWDRWAGYQGHLDRPVGMTEFAGLELPWLVQTRLYAQAVLAQSVSVPADVTVAVACQVDAAGAVLARAGRVLLLVHEWVLRTPVGGPAVMAAQLAHLVRLVSWSTVSMRVVPASLGAHPGMRGSFGLARFVDRHPVVYRHEDNALVLCDDREEASTHQAVLDGLDLYAWDIQRSRSFLSQLAEEFAAEARCAVTASVGEGAAGQGARSH